MKTKSKQIWVQWDHWTHPTLITEDGNPECHNIENYIKRYIIELDQLKDRETFYWAEF